MLNKTLAVLSITLATFAADPALWKYLPSDATAISGIDVEKTKNSPFGRYLMDQVSADDHSLRELQQATGFDPRRDLRSVVVAAAKERDHSIFVARGSFDQARIINAARSEGATIIVHEGFNVIAGKDGGSDTWLAFLDSTSLIGGSADRVRAALNQAKNPQRQPYLDQAMNLAARYDAWVISSDPAGGLLKGIPANQNGDMLRSVREASGGVKFGVNIVIDAKATTRSDKDATALHDAIRFVAGMIRLNANTTDSQKVATLLESMRLSATGSEVSLSLSLPESEIEKLIDTSKPRNRRVARN
jgi:hypothetical protein